MTVSHLRQQYQSMIRRCSSPDEEDAFFTLIQSHRRQVRYHHAIFRTIVG